MPLPTFQDIVRIFFQGWKIINVYPLFEESTLGTIKFIRFVYRPRVSLNCKVCLQHGQCLPHGQADRTPVPGRSSLYTLAPPLNPGLGH